MLSQAKILVKLLYMNCRVFDPRHKIKVKHPQQNSGNSYFWILLKKLF